MSCSLFKVTGSDVKYGNANQFSFTSCHSHGFETLTNIQFIHACLELEYKTFYFSHLKFIIERLHLVPWEQDNKEDGGRIGVHHYKV